MQAATIIMMGVSGCGKTTTGRLIAENMQAAFVDGDDLHPASNIDKMKAGTPLTDDDRAGWLDNVINIAVKERTYNSHCIIACSALKKKYRDKLRHGIGSIVFIYLEVSYEQVLLQMKQRLNHFMPVTLLQSQFDILEVPDLDEKDVMNVPQYIGLQEKAVFAIHQLNHYL